MNLLKVIKILGIGVVICSIAFVSIFCFVLIVYPTATTEQIPNIDLAFRISLSLDILFFVLAEY
jgi:hypothetical protein